MCAAQHNVNHDSGTTYRTNQYKFPKISRTSLQNHERLLRPAMLPYGTISEAAAALGRNLTAGETLWFRYTATVPDYHIYYINIAFLFIIFTLIPLPVALVELCFPSLISRFKLQPKIHLSPSSFLRCYLSVVRVFILAVGPLQVLSYPSVKVYYLLSICI